jgi:hypothetical protein
MKTCLFILSEIQNKLVKMEIEDVSLFIREEYINYHQNTNIFINTYSSNKFKVTNKEMKQLKDSYYVTLAKEKLANCDSVWDEDQREPLERYIFEKNKIDVIVKKEIEFFKKNMEEIDKKYVTAMNWFLEQNKLCQGKKKQLEVLIDSKIKYEGVLHTIIVQLHGMDILKNINKVNENEKSYFKNFLSMNKNKDQAAMIKKKQLIENEANRIKIKLLYIQEEIDKSNLELRDQVINF